MDILAQFLDAREGGKPDAAKTLTPEAMVGRLLAAVNRDFYAKADAKTWLRDRPEVLAVLLWPAAWLNRRGVGLPVEKYEAILREILGGILAHGNVEKIKHFPTYFAHAVNQWFVHRGDALYEERKHIRNALDFRALAARSDGSAKAPDPVESLAAAHRVLTAGKRAAKPAKKDDAQGSLFDA